MSAEAPRVAADPRPVVLLLLLNFNPGVEANGPTQSLIAMVSALSGRFRFRIISDAIEGEIPGQWTRTYGIDRLPLSKLPVGVRGYRRALLDTPHDLLVANSFFDRWLTIPALLMRRLGMIERKPMLIAPRGEFSPGALGLKARRKNLYIKLCRWLGLLDGTAIQATSDEEVELVREILPEADRVFLGPNIRHLPPQAAFSPRKPGAPLRVAFLSRIDRKKNLHFALDVLAQVEVPVAFSIFGPIWDEQYWRECQSRIAAVPDHVSVNYRGKLPNDEVVTNLAAHDLFFLPTLGENYGHAVVDALVAGTPVLLSDQTPWRGLEVRGAGWDLPLDDTRPFATVLKDMWEMNAEAMFQMRARTRAYAEAVLDADEAIRKVGLCLDRAMAGLQGPKRGSQGRRRAARAIDGE